MYILFTLCGKKGGTLLGNAHLLASDGQKLGSFLTIGRHISPCIGLGRVGRITNAEAQAVSLQVDLESMCSGLRSAFVESNRALAVQPEHAGNEAWHQTATVR